MLHVTLWQLMLLIILCLTAGCGVSCWALLRLDAYLHRKARGEIVGPNSRPPAEE